MTEPPDGHQPVDDPAIREQPVAGQPVSSLPAPSPSAVSEGEAAGTIKSDAADASEEQYDPRFSPELFIGIARPMGTPGDAAMAELRNAFADYGYHVEPIKISSLLEDDLLAAEQIVSNKSDERTEALIDEGDRICAEVSSGAALADKAVDEIRLRRAGDEPGSDASRRVFIIDSLKRPAEVKALQGLYGDHFILLGLRASEARRRRNLLTELATRGTHSGTDAAGRADELLAKDNDKVNDFGQQMTPTLAMSDVFIRADSDNDATHDVRRFVRILFGDPAAEQPTLAEYGMQIARQVSVRSPELGLRVGAAILGDAGDVLATGFNHHPTVTGIPDYDYSAVDLRGLARNTMLLLADHNKLDADEAAALHRDPDEYVQDLLKGALKESQLRQVTEFQRPLHAEMDALLSALRQRVEITGGTVYVTDFPCHGCARHLVATGLPVVYLVPYEKGRASDMYADDIDRFTPFVGVTPSRYKEWWVDGRGDIKDRFGRRRIWTQEDRNNAMPKVNPLIDSRVIEAREAVKAGFTSTP